MTNLELAKIIEAVIPQFYLNADARDIEWGKSVSLHLCGERISYITYNTGGRGEIWGRYVNI